MAKRIIHYSFKKAFESLTIADGKAVKAEIIEALGLSQYSRLRQAGD